MNEWINGKMNEGMNEWMNEWMNELINEWKIQKHFIAMIWKRKEKFFFSIGLKKKTIKISKNEWIYEWWREWIHRK